MFRDDQGRYGLSSAAVPHRGTDLAYGRLEDGGLRCAFHGWLFDITGQCLETPAEPEGSRMCANIRQKAYPVVEKSGILFAYMGRRRAAGAAAFRLLRRARDPHLRVQGHDRLQLAAVARSRHRSGAHLVPAPLLPGRGHVDRVTASCSAIISIDSDMPMTRIMREHPRPQSRSSRPTTACASSPCGRSATPTRMCASPIWCSRMPS